MEKASTPSKEPFHFDDCEALQTVHCTSHTCTWLQCETHLQTYSTLNSELHFTHRHD